MYINDSAEIWPPPPCFNNPIAEAHCASRLCELVSLAGLPPAFFHISPWSGPFSKRSSIMCSSTFQASTLVTCWPNTSELKNLFRGLNILAHSYRAGRNSGYRLAWLNSASADNSHLRDATNRPNCDAMIPLREVRLLMLRTHFIQCVVHGLESA